VNSLPTKEELLEFQARWMRPAGILAVSGALLFAVALVLQQTGVGDDDAERLTKFHEHATQLVLAQGVLQGIAVIMFCAPLYVLFKAAQGRAEQVRSPLIAFAFIGPVLFALSSMILTLGLNDVSDKFIEQLPAKEQQARTAAQATNTTPEKQTTTTPQAPNQVAEDAGEDLADDLIDDSGTVQTGALLRFPAILGLIVGLIYIPLWAMRTGLLTRFWATLGMALGASLILVPFGILGVVIWFAAIGLMLTGTWPGPRPPAWDAGEAIPWQRPGDDIGSPGGAGPADTLEGSGREVSEPPLPEDRGDAGTDEAGETPGQRRKKRKRRR
jgi:hypothetical protein